MISLELEAGVVSGNAAAERAHLTQLWQVERDGNPHRRFAHISPFIGKLGPLDASALRRIARLMAASLPALSEQTLILGLTESSLVLAWFLASDCEAEVELRFTTRYCRSAQPGRSFQELHSHGPEHFLALAPGRSYKQVVIVEDELTTGATLRNLLLALRDTATRHCVVTLADMRSPELRHGLNAEMAAHGITLSVTDISLATAPARRPPRLRPRLPHNPFGRAPLTLVQAQEALLQAWQELRPSELYVVGECVDVALAFWESLPARARPALRQVTRSPWLVDGRAIHGRLDFGGPTAPCRYFLYNWTKPSPPRALIISETSTACIAAQLLDFLRAQGVSAANVEVPTEYSLLSPSVERT